MVHLHFSHCGAHRRRSVLEKEGGFPQAPERQSPSLPPALAFFNYQVAEPTSRNRVRRKGDDAGRDRAPGCSLRSEPQLSPRLLPGPGEAGR